MKVIRIYDDRDKLFNRTLLYIFRHIKKKNYRLEYCFLDEKHEEHQVRFWTSYDSPGLHREDVDAWELESADEYHFFLDTLWPDTYEDLGYPDIINKQLLSTNVKTITVYTTAEIDDAERLTNKLETKRNEIAGKGKHFPTIRRYRFFFFEQVEQVEMYLEQPINE